MSMKNIEHVVVLMLENRSFDTMLGWLYEKDAPSLNIPPAAKGDEFRGLHSIDLSKFTNTAGDGLSSPPTRGTSGFTVPSVSPGEEFEHVNMQYFKTMNPTPDEEATMTGVLQDFVNVMKAQKYSDNDIKETAETIMQTYTQGQLPVLNQLAKHYAVCDEWFASVPSQTNPNRAFLMTGTSHGLVNNGELETDPQAKAVEKILDMDIGDDRFPEDTIFNAIEGASADWSVFYQTSYLPQKIGTLLKDAPYLSPLVSLLSPALAVAIKALLLGLKPYSDYLEGLSSGELGSNYTWRLFPAIQKLANAKDNFKSIAKFHSQARQGTLPKFSYIEPYWTIARTSSSDGLKNLFTDIGNDYHPPGNMIVAENFVKEVYTSLIANKEAWDKTLLVITFDESVGSFDHVSPPSAIPPWGDSAPSFPTNGFDFKRYGARVPTILVSPLIEKGTVFRSQTKAPYDHTSVIATILKWLGQNDKVASFGERTNNAPTFDDVITLDEARTDAADIGFLDVNRKMGDPVSYGDPIILKNQNGKYFSTYSRAMKVGTSLPSSDIMGFAVDLNLAAYFPTLDGSKKATLTLRTIEVDPPQQIPDAAKLFVITLETGVGGDNFLGAWADSHDCYYYNNYDGGKYTDNENWVVRQAEHAGKALNYGDKVYLENVKYAGQRLTHDSRLLQGKWISTSKKGGDYWIIEPA